MKIEKVSISRTIPTGPYMNDKISMEASLHGGESHETVLDNLSYLINEWHKKSNPHLYQEGVQQPKELGHGFAAHLVPGVNQSMQQSHPVIKTETSDPAHILTAIQSAPTLEELKTYKTLAASDPTKILYNAYNQRIKELSV